MSIDAVGWQFWIDRGGTFTDCLGLPPDGGPVRVAKVLSSDRAPLVGIRELLGLDGDAPIPPCEIRMGTTVATNALLERRGAPIALIVTRGFADLLEIGTQARPSIFDLEIHKPEVLYREVLEIDARLDRDGNVLASPDRDDLREQLLAMKARGIESVAVVLIHAYVNPELERLVASIAEDVGFGHVSTSHTVANEIGMVGRGDTTTVDAYLTPLIRDYVRTLLDELPGSTLRIMQSSGGLTDALAFAGHNAILSGPAGGVVAYGKVAARAGYERAIGFDMGGTSTDVSRFGGELERVYETEVAGVRLRAPMLDIHTVAAGGGSLCRYDGYRLTVGPESAGAEPGPLCYGNPGASELAITDVNVFLGRVREERFPFPLHLDRVRAALEAIQTKLAEAGQARSLEAIAEGFVEVANANMAEAIQKVSIARGHDVRDHALVVFGGAGGQHACAIARRLGMKTAILHPWAGVLSAYGMGLADVTWHDVADAGRRPLGETDYAETFAALEARGREALPGQALVFQRRWDLRYRGTETSLVVPVDDDPRAAFEALHRRRFGYAREGHPIDVVAIRVEAVAAGHVVHPTPSASDEHPRTRGAVYLDGAWREDVPLVPRESLQVDERLEGPAVILEATGTTVVEAGFTAHVDADRCLVLTATASPQGAEIGTEVDPVQLEIFNNVYGSIAEQMGVVLRRTAISVNIRERLDFSCAVFDAGGGLVANAPHIPVHLGAMSESIRGVLAAHPHPQPGDVFATNDPSGGGSHLPDITVITPVFGEDGALAFFTASRGHHEDVGGITPGSMPPFSKTLEDEGVVFRAERIVRGGRLEQELVLGLLNGATHPARKPKTNLADLEAQVAANHTGAQLLTRMVGHYGADTVAAYMGHVQENARMRVEDAIAELPDGRQRFEDHLDDGSPIVVTIEKTGRRLRIDFEGTGAEQPDNLNAPTAVTVAAVLYVLRSLVGAPIPLNGGCLDPVDLHIPEGSRLSPSPGAAVCGGNVETSQRVVDVLLGALNRAAASQGTMNNLTFGDDTFGYYETIAGGVGATPNAPGASGVHTHMTNTRITDPEVLESRFPVRLWTFSLRRGSGGRGRHRGGDGVVREIEMLAPMRVSILSERRSTRPFGLDGGEPGAAGKNLRDGEVLPGRASVDVAAGQRIRIETPGGGGFGAADA